METMKCDAAGRCGTALDATAGFRAMRAAQRELAAVAARAESARESGRADIAAAIERDMFAPAERAVEVAEAALFAAPSRTLRDFALKVLAAAAADFDSVELNDRLTREARRLAGEAGED